MPAWKPTCPCAAYSALYKKPTSACSRELVLAGQVQASMMRSRLPQLPGWQLAVKLIPAKLTCGDFYDVLYLPDGKVAFMIADVVDKGVGAALYMSMSFTLLRTYALEHPENPEQVFLAVNRRIMEDIETDQFVTRLSRRPRTHDRRTDLQQRRAQSTGAAAGR